MKILFVADEECKYYYDYFQPGRLDEFDLIISCGDLKQEYLSFLVTMAHCPVLYVHGNHDRSYETRPPEGCDCIDGHLVTVNGVRILGLGGVPKYSDGPFQYTEREMKRRLFFLKRKIRKAGGVDIIVTHAPVQGHGDGEDWAHRGFGVFTELIDRWHPKYLVHGHIHLNYGHNIPRTTEYNGTTIVNAGERYILDI